jgi:hypothetical protein
MLYAEANVVRDVIIFGLCVLGLLIIFVAAWLDGGKKDQKK